MSDVRADGYFSACDYIYGYYREISPVFQRFCLMLRGLACADPGEGAAHCELGFGQGVSINIHAAANPGQYVGTDFNPVHAEHARSLARQTGTVRLYDDSFAQLLARNDLPEFDSISLHGIWSWVTQDNRRVILDFISRHLKPGGILYVSYNCFPGSSTAHPLRQLFALHDRYAAASASGAKRVDAALKFAGAVLDAGPLYARGMPAVASRLELIKTQPFNYVAHEYLNREWHCPYFSEVADTLAEAKLDFATTAEPMDLLDSINLTAEGLAFLNAIEHPILREQTRDYFVNRQFRKDLYLRGARRLSPVEQREQTLATRIVLERPVDAIPMTMNGAQGEAAFHKEIVPPLLDQLASRDYAPKSFDDIVRALPTISLGGLVTACAALVGLGHVSPCQAEPAVRQVRKNCRALNQHILERAQIHEEVSYLASPITGGGVALNRAEQLFLLSRSRGSDQPAEWARFTLQLLIGQGQRVLRDGKPLDTLEENLAELVEQANAFEDRMAILKVLEIA